MTSLYSLCEQKEAGLLSERTCFRAAIDSEYLVRRLTKSQVLKGHSGCVNTIAWNESGTRLLSGSDDCHLKIYDAGSGLVRKSVQTTHRSNIFSAKFFPCIGDLRAVSCAGIGSVEFSEFTPDGGYTGHPFRCHNSITYQVTTTPNDPNEFFTCEERGYVRLYDLRVRSSCICDGCKRDVLYSFPASVTSMAVHPLSPFYVAFACGDGSVRLVDRRMSLDSVGKIDTAVLAERGTVRQYKPYSIGSQPHKITSIQFNATGSELLVSFSEDYIYLFNSQVFQTGGSLSSRSSAFISKPVYLSQLEYYSPRGRRQSQSSVKRKPPSSSHCGKSTPASSLNQTQKSSEDVPPAKKLRLRGDWSDTGPEARPESSSEEGRRDRGHLMNRMSRMFAQWIDMSLSPGSTNDSSDREGAPSRYRRRRRIFPPTAPPPPDGASPTTTNTTTTTTTSSNTSSNNSFQWFDSENEEAVEEGEGEEEGRERGNSKLRDRPPTLESRDDITPEAVDLSNGSNKCATKSEGVATKDLSTSTEVARTATQASTNTGTADHKAGVLELSADKQHFCEKSDVQEGECDMSTSDAELPNLTVSGEVNDKSNDSSKNTNSFRTHDMLAEGDQSNSSDLMDGISDQTQSCDPANSPPSPSSQIEVTIENRTTNASPNHAPAVVIEGETDSDDSDGGRSCDDESHDCQEEGSHDLEENSSVFGHYFMRYKGHRNSRTMIKQANFWGENWVLSGSDCGRVFVWDKWSGRVVNMLMADSHVVNCVQPHPEAYVLATSGIDYDIKIWEPLSAEACSLGNLQEVVDRNEVMLEESRNTITVPSMFVFRILAYLQRRRRMQQGQDETAGDESD